MTTNKTSSRKPYNGDRKALVVAFDVGTTFSGVSYAILEPGEIPKTLGVTRYPGQEHVTGNTKIPSLLYYDRTGKLRAAGAEAESSQIAADAEDEGWVKVELFKLRLRPKTMHLETNGIKFSPLPPGKSTEHVFGDFLRYLFSCTRRFIEDSHAAGDRLWKQVENNIHFVLSHPNGWEGPQQSRMRRAAIYAGLIPDTDEGKARIRFVTEGEASMHACIHNGLAHDVLQSGNGFIVADAGGGTLDISSYILRGMHPLTLEEVAPPDCIFAGAVFVSRRCRVFLQGKLKDSKYGTLDALDHITKRFDETTKRLFRDKNDTQYIHFGSPLDRDLKVGIRNGQLKLTGEEVASFFEPSIEAAVSSIMKQIEGSKGVVKAVWLVGGFAASPWLFSQMQERLAPLGVTVNRPDSQTSKAVADGAIGFFCDHHVSARMSRYMYGVEFLREINNDDEEHRARQGRLLQLPSGPRFLPDAFDCILAKGVRVKESSVFSRKYYTEVTKLSTLSVFEIEIWCFRGGDTVPQWIERNSDQFASLCFVRADLSKLSNSAQPKTGPNGQTYWTVVFSIEIHFGLTEFKARMKWNEDGKTRYGPASIVFNEKGVRSDEDEVYSIVDDDLTPQAVAPSLSSRQTSTSTTAPMSTSSSGMSKTPSMTSDAVSSATITDRPASMVSSANKSRSKGLTKNAGHTPPPSNTPSSIPPSTAPSRVSSTMSSSVPSRVSSTISSSAPRSRTTSTSSASAVPASAPPIAPSASNSSKKELPTIAELASPAPAPAPAPVSASVPESAPASVTPSPTDTLVNASTPAKSRRTSRILTSSVKASPISRTSSAQEATSPSVPKKVDPSPPPVEEVKPAEPPAPEPQPVSPRTPTPAPARVAETPEVVPDPVLEPMPAETPASIAQTTPEPVATTAELTAEVKEESRVEEVRVVEHAVPKSPAKKSEEINKSPVKDPDELPKSPKSPMKTMQDPPQAPINPPALPKNPAKNPWGSVWGKASSASKNALGTVPSGSPVENTPSKNLWDNSRFASKSVRNAFNFSANEPVDQPQSPAKDATDLPKSPANKEAELPKSPAAEPNDLLSGSPVNGSVELHPASLFPSVNGDAENEEHEKGDHETEHKNEEHKNEESAPPTTQPIPEATAEAAPATLTLEAAPDTAPEAAAPETAEAEEPEGETEAEPAGKKNDGNKSGAGGGGGKKGKKGGKGKKKK